MSLVAAHAKTEPLVVRGFAEVASYKPLLMELAKTTGQAGSVDDLDFFLSTPDAVKKIPYLVLRRGGVGEGGVRGFSGATLLFEYKTLLGGARVFATADASGRRTVLARDSARGRVAAEVARTLLRRGAHVVHVAYRPGMDNRIEQAASDELTGGWRGGVWSLLEQLRPTHLPLEETFDLTLARVGRRTRTNLRYYWRRTERDLGCTYIEDADMSQEEFLTMNRTSKYAVSDEMARWRYRSLKVVANPLFCGIKDRDGLWLSLVGGRRREGEVEIDWQMNRDGLARYSLSTVVRACLIDQEIVRGTERLYLEGGTRHALGHAFLKEPVAELTVKRGSAYVGVLERFAERLFPEKNYLSQVLRNPELKWRAM